MSRLRDAEASRARILSSATHHFAERGYEGSSLNAIVAAAGINKRMVYHYFASKEGLYHAVFAAQWQALSAALEGLEASLEGTASERLLSLLGAFFDFMAAHQDFTRLMMWEGLEGGALSRSLWRSITGPLFARVRTLIVEAQRSGSLAPELQPGHFVVSFLGIVCHHFAYAGSLADLLGQDPLSRAGIASRREQVLTLLSGLMRAP